MLKKYTDHYSEIWKSCSEHFPGFSKRYNSVEKRQKEEVLDQFLKSVKSFRKQRIRNKLFQSDDSKVFILKTRGFLRDGLDFDNDQLELMFSDDMVALTKEFVQQAREFDAELSFPDIFQACRNVWIMNGLQFILGLKMELTPSILAYSLLYPYTDNMIDDPEISGFEKMIFSSRFRDRLSGIKLEPENKTERAIYRLVEMIENQYSRVNYPEVFESLLGIHEAQTNSLKLIYEKLTETEILKICIEKGSASVLTDGFLVAGKLSESQQYFLSGFGAYLQLLDDIQDVEEDSQAGLKTVFSGGIVENSLDSRLNKTYWFGEKVMENLDFFDGQHIDLFKSLMRKSMDLFIIEAIAQNPETYSRKYIANVEECSPFHFSYIRKRKEQFAPYNGFLLTAIEEIAADNFRKKKPELVSNE